MEKIVKSTEPKCRIAPRKYPSGVLRLNAVRKDVPDVEPGPKNERRTFRRHEKFQPRKRVQAAPLEKTGQSEDPCQNRGTPWSEHDYHRGPSYPEQQQIEARKFRIVLVAGGGIALVFVLLSLFKSAF